MKFIKENGRLPEWLVSKEDQNSVGESGVSEDVVEEMKSKVGEWLERGGKNLVGEAKKMVIMDGFLIYGESVKEVREAIDIRLMLRAKFKKAKERREKRTGYVTLEGFWEDPPDYVEKIVWPGYVEEHGFMFTNGDVDGEVDKEVVGRFGIEVCPGEGEWNISQVLRWAVLVIIESLERLHSQDP